jgi:hypothetical protein
VLLALTTGHKIGFAGAGVVFIAFALASSMLVPRRDPGFPGKVLPAFVVVTVVLFVGMLASVEIFGAEKQEPSENTPAQTTPSQ